MKKQRKQLIIMEILLVFLIFAYVGLGAYNKNQTKNEEENQETIQVTDLNVEDVVAFSYNYEEESNHFTKSDDVWSYDANADFDVEESLVEAMLADACNLIAQDYMENYEALDNYGLDEPQKTVSMTLSDGSTVLLQLGDYNDIMGYYYLMVEGDNNLYMVDSTLLDAFEVSYADLEHVAESTETTETVEETELEESTE